MTSLIGSRDEMANLVRTKDWAATPLGPLADWPQSLRTTISLCLASNFPINIIWGPGHTQIYNDGYRVVCGDAHPTALGQDYSVTWASAWPAIGEPFTRALGGETSFLENQRMFLTRNGYLEETFFTFSLSPIRGQDGTIEGLFHPVTETTGTMLAERRTRAVRDLTASISRAADVGELASLVIQSLTAFAFDLPFVLLYRLDPESKQYHLAAQCGVSVGDDLNLLDPHSSDPWPIAALLAGGGIVEVDDIGHRFKGASCGPYEEPPTRAMMLSATVPGLAQPPIFTVFGISSRLPYDDVYRGFYELLGAALGAALASVRAREDERRRAEALAAIDRAKTAFFSNVSHEFRTPLALMLGPLEDVLAAQDRLPRQQLEQVTVAHRNGMRLLKLVNTLLDFSRIEAGRAQACFEPTDLASLTAGLASNFQSACEKAGLRLVVDTAPLPEPVYLDGDMWEKIVLNLVSNAFKFTFDGEIRVTVRPSSGQNAAEVIVADTGIGIESQNLPHLFERFYQVETAKGRSFEGSGIGLALVNDLVKLHGGKIAVTSEPGLGTTFTVTIPLGSAHLPADQIEQPRSSASTATRADAFVQEALRWLPDPSASNTPDGEPPPGRTLGEGRRILLADDNADMRSYVQRLLHTEGFSVQAVPDGEVALAAAIECPPDLILSDMMMPRLDGFGLLDAVRSASALREVPFILLSARAGEDARVEGLAAGADDYLIKPFAARELVARIAATLNHARDRREMALRASEAHLRALNADLERKVIERSQARGRAWQVSPDLMGALNARGYFETSNPAWYTMLGWSEAEVAATSIFELLHPDDIERTRAKFDLTQQGHPAIRFPNRYRHKDGSYRWISWVGVPEDAYVYCTGRDFTAEKEQGDALAELTAERDHMWQSSPDILAVVDLDGIFRRVSPACTKILGLDQNEMIGMRVDLLIHPDDVGKTEEALVQATDGPLLSFENRYRHKDGSYRVISWVTAPEGHLLYCIGRDVTPERERADVLAQTEAALRQAQKMEAVGQLTGGLAHDFNNLLTGISGSLELLQARVAQGRVNELDRYVSVAQGAAKRAAALTHRLLAFSRRQTLDPKPTDVNRLAMGMEELVRRTVGPAITVEVVASGGLWPVMVDQSQLENAIMNLCINARDAMPDGGQLTIETANRWLDDRSARERGVRPGQYVSLCVSDNGIGMPPDVISQAFDPFFTTKPIGQGTGLGLSMIYGFCQQSSGQVRIYSELGHGTTVRIYLPRYFGEADADEALTESSDTPRAGVNETVLVIDDEASVRMLVIEVLEELGYRAIEASDGASGLKVVRSESRIDLLVTDVGLPGLNGRQVADAARVIRPNLKVLFITGYAENAVLTHGHLDPNMHVLTKPFTLDVLGRRIRELIEKK